MTDRFDHADGFEHTDELRRHWWWRPGWRQGRHVYACHFTFRDQPAVQQLAGTCRRALAAVPGLEPIPAQWLHLTMQEVAFTDEVSPEQLDSFMAAAARELAAVPLPQVTLHPPVVVAEAVLLPVTPSGPVDAVRTAIRSAVADALPRARPTVIERYRPHVSVAYSNLDQPAGPVHRALADLEVESVSITLPAVGLLEYHRDDRMYVWDSNTPLTIGAGNA